MWSLITAMLDASEAAPLRRRVAELEATNKRQADTIAELTRQLDFERETTKFYYGLATDKPARIMEDDWSRCEN